MQEVNHISAWTRLKELAIDYLVIVVYLVVLFAITMTVYLFVFEEIPQANSGQLQLVATLTTVIPAVVLFAVLDYRKPYGTYGKRKVGLKVKYKIYSFWRSLVRNVVKFLPWQLAHMGVIGGIFTNFESLVAMGMIYTSIALTILLFCMALIRKDKRHIGDMLAGTKVVRQKI